VIADDPGTVASATEGVIQEFGDVAAELGELAGRVYQASPRFLSSLRGRVVILAAGTGNPFFTTDTAAALRAAEMSCDAMLKATQVDGVYSADPKKVPDAKRYDSLTYHEVLAQNLQVMDAAAISLSRENRIPILVFSLADPGELAKVLRGEGRATIIEEK